MRQMPYGAQNRHDSSTREGFRLFIQIWGKFTSFWDGRILGWILLGAARAWDVRWSMSQWLWMLQNFISVGLNNSKESMSFLMVFLLTTPLGSPSYWDVFICPFHNYPAHLNLNCRFGTVTGAQDHFSGIDENDEIALASRLLAARSGFAAYSAAFVASKDQPTSLQCHLRSEHPVHKCAQKLGICLFCLFNSPHSCMMTAKDNLSTCFWSLIWLGDERVAWEWICLELLVERGWIRGVPFCKISTVLQRWGGWTLSHARIDCNCTWLILPCALIHVEFLCFVPSPPAGAGTSTTECRLTGASMRSKSKHVDV